MLVAALAAASTTHVMMPHDDDGADSDELLQRCPIVMIIVDEIAKQIVKPKVMICRDGSQTESPGDEYMPDDSYQSSFQLSLPTASFTRIIRPYSTCSL